MDSSSDESTGNAPVIFKSQNRFRFSKSLKTYTAIVFIVVFACLGAYLLHNSFADTESLTKTWSTTADWNGGTLSDTTISGNSVILAPVQTSETVYNPVTTANPATTTSTTNLALNKPAFATSQQSSKLGARNAFDGQLSTRWSSSFSNSQWLTVDLGSTYTINRVDLHWETAYGKAYKIQVSKNGWDWTTIYSTTEGVGGDNNLTGLSGVGRYVRMLGVKRGTQWGYSLWEMAVYGTPVSQSSTPPTTTTTTPSQPSTAQYQNSGSITLDFDASTSVSWTTLTTQTTLPTDTAITYKVRTSTDNTNWSAWTSNISQAATSRYIQIEADLSTTNSTVTPTLKQLTLGYNLTVAAPTVTLKASSSTVTTGQTVTLSWSSTNTTSCSASGGWSGDQALSGSVSTGALSQTTTYTINCSGAGGSTSANTTVTVSAPAPAPSPPSSTSSSSATPASLMPSSLFSQNVTGWSVDTNSAEYVNDFVNDYTTDYGSVGVNFNIPIYAIPAGTSNTKVAVASGCNDFTGDQTASNGLGATGTEVPIPSFAQTPGTSDNPLIIYSTTLNKEWEFWQFNWSSSDTASACWGGEIPLSSSTGVFPVNYGLSATGISYMATAITEADVESGSINHAIAIILPACNGYNDNSWDGVYPADRTDCGDNPGQPAEGQWFRFSSSATMPAGLSPFAQMVFNAGKKYGFIVTDQGGAVMLSAEQPSDWQTEGNSGTDPFTTSDDGLPEYSVVASLPWSQLQAVDPPQQ